MIESDYLKSVPDDVFSDACLVLVAHGSTVNADSSIPVRQLAHQFRERGMFAEVVAGLVKEEPPISEILNQVRSLRVFIVPFFISEGYFTEEVVPRALGLLPAGQARFDRVQRRANQLLTYCRPVGTHERMTDVVLARARAVLQSHPFPHLPHEREVSLYLAGHGTSRNSRSRESVEHQASLIRRSAGYADVRGVFMEEQPRIADCLESAATRHVVVVPFFLSDGLHVAEDIPVLLGEPERWVRERVASGEPTWRNPTERQGRLVWYSGAVGTDPLISMVVMERVREAALWPAPLC